MTIPFVYNLILKHRGCMVMIHRETSNMSDKERMHYQTNSYDLFNPEEADPMKTKALGSSIWELSSMINHYSEPVRTLANMFEDRFERNPWNMEDFLDHSYTTVRLYFLISCVC